MSRQSRRGHRPRRLLTLITATAAGLLVGAGTAAAHVAVTPTTASAGEESVNLTFHVPNESETAGTVGVTVRLPAGHPFADVSVKAVPGWTVTPKKQTLPAPVTEGDITIKEAVTSVTWAAESATRIGPGEFAEFEISAGPVPAVESLQFPVTQTYDDGTIVKWDEPTPASGAEPEHPVPTLTVEAAGDGAAPGTAAAVSSHPSEEPAAASEATADATVSAAASNSQITDGSNSTAVILAVVGIVVGSAALLVGAIALRRRPSARGGA